MEGLFVEKKNTKHRLFQKFKGENKTRNPNFMQLSLAISRYKGFRRRHRPHFCKPAKNKTFGKHNPKHHSPRTA
jgi:hypothetical protein